MSKAAHSQWTRGEHLFISGLADFVNFTIAYPCTYADVVQKIAEHRKLAVEGLPDEWKSMQLPERMPRCFFDGWNGGKDEHGAWFLIVSGSASEKIKSLTGHFENVEYKIVGRALRFRVVATEKGLSSFDELAGRLTHEVPRGSNGKIPDADYRRIMGELDKAGYRPIDCLESESRRALAVWNSTHSKDGKGRQSFSSAYRASQFRRGVQRRLNRAQGKYKKAYGIA